MGKLTIDEHMRVHVDKQKQTVLINAFLKEIDHQTMAQIDVPEFSDEEYDEFVYEEIYRYRFETIEDVGENLLHISLKNQNEILLSFIKYRLFKYLDSRLTIDIKRYLAKEVLLHGVHGFLEKTRGDNF